jgi:hypothetical protein
MDLGVENGAGATPSGNTIRGVSLDNNNASQISTQAQEAGEIPEDESHLKEATPWAMIFKWNFFRTVLTHICVMSLIGGAIIMALSPDVDYLDALFLATTSLTGTGITVVSMLDVHRNAFIVIFVLMLMGNGMVIQMCALLFRM